MKIIKADIDDEIIFNTIEDIDTGVTTGITSILTLPTGNLNNILIDFNFKNKKLCETLRMIANFNINNKYCIDVELREITIGEKTFENACYIPAEVFSEPCRFWLGIYGYALENENEIKQRVSLVPLESIVVKGSYEPDANESIVPTPTLFEKYFEDVAKAGEQIQENLDEYNSILAEKLLFHKKLEGYYKTIADYEEEIVIDLENYSHIDTLFVDIEGRNLVENVDYTKIADTKRIKLTLPVDKDTIIHYIVLKTTIVDAKDYDFLRGAIGKYSEYIKKVVTDAETDTFELPSEYNDNSILNVYINGRLHLDYTILNGNIILNSKVDAETEVIIVVKNTDNISDLTDRMADMETQMGDVSAILDIINGEVI